MSDIEDDDGSIPDIDDDMEDSDAYLDPDDEGEFTDYETDDEIMDEKEEPQKDDIQIHYVVPDDKRITSDILSYYDYVRIVGKRANQIENGDTADIIVFTDVEDIINSSSTEKAKEMAEKEIKENKCPYMIKKEYVNGNIISCEIWDINKMKKPFL